MLEVNIDGVLFNLKQDPNEFTIGEYEDIVSILKDPNTDEFDKYYDLFIYLGIPSELLDEFDIFHFKDLINGYNKSDKPMAPMVNTFQIDGVTYKSYDKEFKISLKQMMTAIDYVKKDNVRCLAEIVAVFFHDINLSREENWNNIDDRAELFRERLTADIANPYFIELIKKMYENTK